MSFGDVLSTFVDIGDYILAGILPLRDRPHIASCIRVDIHVDSQGVVDGRSVFHIQHRNDLFVIGVGDTPDPSPRVGLDLLYF
jgi:hypothetical protein